jgi:DNA-binding MarR family transcriptional regulator
MSGDLTNPTLRALRRILRAADIGGRQLASATGLTPSQLLVLREIERRGESTPSMVAHALQFGQATITNILDRLESSGFVSRQRSEKDRRQVRLQITPSGAGVLEAAPDLLQQQFSERFAGLPSWEQAMILASLERLSAMLGAGEMDAAPLLDAGAIDRRHPG